MTPSKSSTDEDKRGSGRTLLVLLVLACVGGAAAALYKLKPTVLTGLGEASDKHRVVHACEKLAAAIERRDRNAVEALVSTAYHDGRGLTREQAVRALFLYLDAHGFQHVSPMTIRVVDVAGDSAHAMAITRLAQAEPPPKGREDAFRLDLALQREGGSWRLTSAEDFQIPDEDLEQVAGE